LCLILDSHKLGLNLRNANTHKAMDTWIQRHKATIRG
jgi:hypothetical protein